MAMEAEEILKRLRQFPRAALGYYPTPLDRWARLEAYLGWRGAIYAKREDLTGLAFGGNKVRQLEFHLGEALARRADVIVHGAAVQSNYCRLLVAAANKLGLASHLVLSRAYGQAEDQGNILLDRIAGATIELIDEPLGPRQEAYKRRVVARLAAAGRRPFLITYPESEILGTLSYVKAAVEVFEQCGQVPGPPRFMIMAATGATQAGFLLGSRLLGWDVEVVGIAPVRHNEFPILQALPESIEEASKKLGVEPCVLPEEIRNLEDYVGEGYGRVIPAAINAIKVVARTEGVFLDPLYSGRAMAGLLDLIQSGKVPAGEDLLFVHTGGNTALFAYHKEILECL
jgi:1-aminocyclopropane-1-carboxylate deaminase/D-cysteine desulfhydrase-like pyridoxal-dependent ACC family enzyme